MAFYTLKGGLSQSERPPFEKTADSLCSVC